jgi:hypothetical protein
MKGRYMRLKRAPRKRRSKIKRAKRTPKLSTPLASLAKQSLAARDRSLHVIASLRNNPNLAPRRAAKQEGVKLETVKKYFPSAFKKVKGKLRVTKSDRFTETLYLPGRDGSRVPIKTRSSKQRTAAGQYLRDLGRHQRGNRAALKKWKGKSIAGHELVTDERTLRRIEPALSDFALYRAFNGGNA